MGGASWLAERLPVGMKLINRILMTEDIVEWKKGGSFAGMMDLAAGDMWIQVREAN